MKKFTCILITTLLTLAFLTISEHQASAQSKTLVVAMELAYPPFEAKDEAGKPVGISVDIVNAFGKYADYDVKVENISWDGLIPSLQTGKADMVISSMTITKDRLKTVDFSDPYANCHLAILANKNSGIKSVEDLNQPGKKVAVKTGSTGYFYATTHLPKARVIGLPDESACVTEVAQGKADGFLYDQLTIYRNWAKFQDTTTAVFIPFQEPEKWGIAVKKGNTKLLKELNAFLAEFKKQGGYEELTKKYMSEEKAIFDQWGFTWFFNMEN